MRTRDIATALLLLLLLLMATPGVVHAQGGAIANAGVGLAAGSDTTDLAISVGFGYRFNRSMGLGVEVTHMPSLESGFGPGLGGGRFGGDYEGDDNEGRATIFTTNVRVEIPTSARSVIPYVIGGGGVASVTEVYQVAYGVPANTNPSLSRGAPTGANSPSLVPTIASIAQFVGIRPGPSGIRSTTTAMALTLGGGASLLVTDHFAVDIDLRVLKLLGDTDRNIGRFGVGASFRF